MNDGILLIDKEAGMTSRKVDNLIGRKLGQKKVGHLGTLDPFATGLLIVSLGKASKFLPYIDSSFKTYEATLKLGSKTDTGDLTGALLSSKPVRKLSESEINDALSSFLGVSYQLPPMTSAIKKDGVALYKLAHKGESAEREKRRIEIKEIGLIELGEDTFSFRVTSSSGTYIRTLGEDIAERLGTVGHLEALRRIKIGDADVLNAKRIEQVSEDDLLSPSSFLTLEKIEIDEKEAEDARNGKKMRIEKTSGDEVALMKEGEAIAVYVRLEGDVFVSKRGLF